MESPPYGKASSSNIIGSSSRDKAVASAGGAGVIINNSPSAIISSSSPSSSSPIITSTTSSTVVVPLQQHQQALSSPPPNATRASSTKSATSNNHVGRATNHNPATGEIYHHNEVDLLDDGGADDESDSDSDREGDRHKMRRSRTQPLPTSPANGGVDGKQQEQQSSQKEENSSNTSSGQQAAGSNNNNNNNKSPRPPLLTRKTPTSLPTRGSRSPTTTEASQSPHIIQHHAATFPPDRPGKASLEGADADGYHAGKEKKKGVSFLSRFIPGAGSSTKKHAAAAVSPDLDHIHERPDRDENDDSNESNRPEGMDAQLFSHAEHDGADDDVDGIAFQPKYPQPPPYIKFRAKFKKEREFDHVFLAQELQAGRQKPPRRRGTTQSLNSPALQGTPLESDENAVWAMEFSKDGKYLAAAGQDRIVRVWAVLGTAEERREHESEEDEDARSIHRMRLDAPVFQKRPIQEYEGHEGPIIDLSWSKNNFLLSASADKTVRLWHTSRAECLCTFKHTEHVHAVQFHPRDDRFFLAGSRDMKLRFWSIPDKSVAFWQQLSDIITAVAFTPDGKTAMAGTVNGVCNFYETEGLKYQTQIHVRSAYGKNAKPSKICSIEAVNVSETERPDVKLLISSNDSRIRLYNFRDKSLETKFKGHKSEERTIKAQFSDNGQYIVSGSEDKGAFLWSTGPSESEKPSQRPVEFFEATTSQTTCAILAPTKTRQLLAQSEDPIYDLCNPPPVTLVSRSESVASSHARSRTNSIAGTPRTGESPRRKAIESPAYLARSAHVAGNIIVTASNTGVIRVYRQDCAFTKRKSADDSSSLFNKRPSSVYMARAMSRSSTGMRAPSRSESVSTQPPNDRIMTWRQGVSSTHSLDRKQSDAKSTRSMSPSKTGYSFRRSSSIRRSVGNGLSGRKGSVDAMTPMGPPSVKVDRVSTPSLPRKSESSPSPPSVKNAPSSMTTLSKQNTAEDEGSHLKALETHSSETTPSPSPDPNPLWLQNGQSFLGWNMKEYASQAFKKLSPTATNTAGGASNDRLRPELATQNSAITVVSTLSSDEQLTPEKEKELQHTQTLKCTRCGGTGFRTRKEKGGEQRLSCQRCGTLVGAA